MGMQDQYDDGRYDPGCIEMPEPFTLPRIQRGGIKYPTPTKEAHMPEPRMTKAQIDHELRTNTELMTALRHRRNQLKKERQKAIPSEPPPNFTMFTVAVRFKMRGTRYQFLILRHGGVYFTTGGRPEHAQFSSWEALCEWLEGPEVYDHSDLEILKASNAAVSFTSGAIETAPIGEPPF